MDGYVGAPIRQEGDPRHNGPSEHLVRKPASKDTMSARCGPRKGLGKVGKYGAGSYMGSNRGLSKFNNAR